MAPAAKQPEETDEAKGRQTENKLVYGCDNKKYHYIFLWHYFGSKWSPVHYFDDRPMPLMVI